MYNGFLKYIPHTERNEKLMAPVIKCAEEEIEKPIASLPFSAFRLFHITGNRTDYEKWYFEHRKLLCVFSAMSLWDKDEKWLLKLSDVLFAVCDEFTWALPAHIKIDADLESAMTKIDLFASETSMALSEILYLLEDRLPKTVSDRVKYEIERRILIPYKKKSPRFGISNWSAVCGGSVGCTFMYRAPDEFETVLPALTRNIDDFLASFSDDGCCLEGPLYWSYGFSYFCYYADMIYQFTDGKINYFEKEKVKRIAHFGQNGYLKDNFVIPFSDSPHVYKYNRALWYLIKSRYPDIVIPDEKFGNVFGDVKRYRYAEFIRQFFIPELPESEKSFSDETVYYPDGGWFIRKKEKYSFAAKGGHNAEPHNHNDVGSFVLLSDGKFVLDDAGFPEYDKQYFTDKRYDNICASSLGHSLPIIDGEGQKAGIEYRAEVVLQEKDAFGIEFSAAYGKSQLSKLYRTFETVENGVKITDKAEGNVKLRERFVSEIKPEIKGNSVVLGDFTLSCDVKADIKVGSFDYFPRFATFSDITEPRTLYLIDFEPENREKLVFTVKTFK